MKLFTRYFRINLLATVFIFVLASLAFFFLLRYVSIRQVDDDLRIEQREIESYLVEYKKPPEPISVHDQSTTYEVSDIQKPYRTFRTIKSPQRGDEENFRQILFTARVGDQWLLFKVSKSLEQTEHLNRSIIAISLITIIAILIVSLLINRWLLRRLWKPFYLTLDGLEKYRLGEKILPSFEKDPIYEFNLLNHTVNRFIRDAEKEFLILKEFTENASHELQTPLAIVRTSLDIMTQDENLSESQSHLLQNAFGAIQKMTRLNQSLLLLNKIENKQFASVSAFDFKTLVDEKMTGWQELWQGRDLHVSANLNSVMISMNEQLAEIMLSNLFSNAARHCVESGDVHLELKSNGFSISNTAYLGPLDTETLFKRFSKTGQSTDQHGLGLSIVKQIAEVSRMQVNYGYSNGTHTFSVLF
jgi:signal transduction histidine kinase